MKNTISKILDRLVSGRKGDKDPTPKDKRKAKAADEALVRLLLPSGTKTGPGIRDRRWRAFCAFTPEQKQVALDNGWVPQSWADRTSREAQQEKKRRRKASRRKS